MFIMDRNDGGDMHTFFQNGSDRILYVAVSPTSNIVVGMGGVILHPSSSSDSTNVTSELVRMQLLEDHQGMGYGKKLLSACEEWARRNNSTQMFLDTWLINTSAQNFYERNGYIKEKVVKYELADRFYKTWTG